MKNFSKTIASISLSLLTIGAMAQSTTSTELAQKPNVSAYQMGKSKFTPASKASHKVGGATTYNGYLDYVYWDNNANSGTYHGGPDDNSGWGVTDINMHYVVSDTAHVGSSRKNYTLLHFMTVAFDSLWDEYSQSILPQSATKITSVDTVWALVDYKNSTNTNDTLIFQGVNTVKGYPGTTQLFADTVILGADSSFVLGNWYADTSIGQYLGDSLDRLYYIPVLPNYTPTTNSFAVNIKYYGSKSDTLGLAYGYPYFICGGTNAYANLSAIGMDLDGLKYVNTFTTGWAASTQGHAVTQFPTNTGGILYYKIQQSVCGDTIGFVYQQDAGIFAAFTYTNSTGVNNISASGLSVGQNYPNPFNQQTQITYSLTQSSTVTFTVYDITGRVIMSDNYNTVAAGQHEINLSANSFSPGIYFYTFNVNGNTVTKKMVITQ